MYDIITSPFMFRVTVTILSNVLIRGVKAVSQTKQETRILSFVITLEQSIWTVTIMNEGHRLTGIRTTTETPLHNPHAQAKCS
jgi:hypothetical protein